MQDRLVFLVPPNIEFNDFVRKSAYSFEIQNNNIRLFPEPTTNFKLWFQYYTKASKVTSSLGTENNVTNFADMSQKICRQFY